MEIITVKLSKSGFVINESVFVPIDINNSDYQGIQTWIAAGGIVAPEFTIDQVRANKINELTNYHFNSSDIRILTINRLIGLSLSSEGRTLVSEQITQLEQKVRLGLVLESAASFQYFYGSSSISVSLNQLRGLFVQMLTITNANFANYQLEISNITNLESLEDIESYNFTANYIKNFNVNL